MQILKNVYLIGGYPYPYHRYINGYKLKNVYAVKGKESVIWIDTGEDEKQLKLAEENMRYWGLYDYPISHILITHSHYAHCANAHILRKRGAKIVASIEDAEGIESGDDRTIGYAYTHKERFIPCKVDLKVKDGDELKIGGLTFKVIAVPGHTRGSVFYRLEMEGKTILFTGDTVKVGPYCSKAKLGWNGAVDYDRDAYIASIKKISSMSADILLPGDSQPCLKEGWEILENTYIAVKMRLLNQPADT